MTEEITNVSIRVLMVEDNPVDVDLLSMVFEETKWPVESTVVDDGEKAIDLLKSLAANGHPGPDLVILDLNLPRRDGTEVLQAIRSTKGLTDTTVAIFSSSPQDVIQSKLTAAGVTANGHFTKPHSYDGFLQLAHNLRSWFEGQKMVGQAV